MSSNKCSAGSCVAVAVLALFGLAACTTVHPIAGDKYNPSSSVAASAVAPFATTYGEDAALIANHVPGCKASAAGIGNGAATGMVSTATCEFEGHQVQVFSWKDANSEFGSNEVNQTAGLPYWASGTGWDEVVTDTAAPDAQQAIAKAFTQALGGTVEVATTGASS